MQVFYAEILSFAQIVPARGPQMKSAIPFLVSGNRTTVLLRQIILQMTSQETV